MESGGGDAPCVVVTCVGVVIPVGLLQWCCARPEDEFFRSKPCHERGRNCQEGGGFPELSVIGLKRKMLTHSRINNKLTFEETLIISS